MHSVLFQHSSGQKRLGHMAPPCSSENAPRSPPESAPFLSSWLDGDHSSKCVLIDAVSSWDLANEGGRMILDDHVRPHPIPTEMQPPPLSGFSRIR